MFHANYNLINLNHLQQNITREFIYPKIHINHDMLINAIDYVIRV